MFQWLRAILHPAAVKKEIEVSLEELSTIWLKYNCGFSGQKTEESSALAKDGDGSTASEKKEEPGKEEPKYVPQAILSEFIEPYKNLLEGQKALDGLLSIIDLLDRFGGCPSVVTTLVEKDSESEEIYSIREVLLKVTLREHSLNVARNLLKLLKGTYKDYENLIPKALVCSLGHDIGKIPEIRESGLYVKADHPNVSAQKLKELFSGKEPLWFEAAVEAVRSHHRASKDSFSQLLREADSKAREMEVSAYGHDIKIGDLKEWFDIRRFLEILKAEVNVMQKENRWKAFSFGSIVYCQPDFLYESGKRLSREKKVVDLKLLRISGKESSIRKIVERLKEEGIVGHEIGEAYWGRVYEIQSGKFKKKFFLIPLKIEAFGKPYEIEKVKEGYLETIQAVFPIVK
jgi:hypothetical protein